MSDNVEQREEAPKEIPIAETLNNYLKLRDFDLEYSDDRKKLFKGLDDDSVILDYLDSKSYINNQVKKKKDRLSESDPICRRLDAIAYYLLYSDFENKQHHKNFLLDKTGEVLNNSLENNRAYKRDYKIKEVDRNYGYPTMSKYAMNRNRSDNYNKGKNKIREVFITDEHSGRFPLNQHTSEFEAYDAICDNERVKSSDFNVYEILVYSLKEPKNVLLFLRYEYEALSEISNFIDSDVRLASYVLEDIICEVIQDKMDIDIIDHLKNGLDYKQIKKALNKKYKINYTYEMVRYKINEILQAISNRVKSKIKELI